MKHSISREIVFLILIFALIISLLNVEVYAVAVKDDDSVKMKYNAINIMYYLEERMVEGGIVSESEDVILAWKETLQAEYDAQKDAYIAAHGKEEGFEEKFENEQYIKDLLECADELGVEIEKRNEDWGEEEFNKMPIEQKKGLSAEKIVQVPNLEGQDPSVINAWKDTIKAAIDAGETRLSRTL